MIWLAWRQQRFPVIAASVLIGIYLMSVFSVAWPDRLLPTAITVEPPAVPALLRALMTTMGVTALLVFAHDLWRWLRWPARPALAAPAAEARR